MNKFENAIKSIKDRLDNIENEIKKKPPKTKGKPTEDEFKLLREHYDGMFDNIKSEIGSLREMMKPAENHMKQGKSIIDLLFKWPDFDGTGAEENSNEPSQKE
jgi:hypothetical protein